MILTKIIYLLVNQHEMPHSTGQDDIKILLNKTQEGCQTSIESWSRASKNWTEKSSAVNGGSILGQNKKHAKVLKILKSPCIFRPSVWNSSYLQTASINQLQLFTLIYLTDSSFSGYQSPL